MGKDTATIAENLQNSSNASFSIPKFTTIYKCTLKSTGNDFGSESEIVVDLNINVLGGKGRHESLRFNVPDNKHDLDKELLAGGIDTFFLPPISFTVSVYEHDTGGKLFFLREDLDLSNADKWLTGRSVTFNAHPTEGYEAELTIQVFAL